MCVRGTRPASGPIVANRSAGMPRSVELVLDPSVRPSVRREPGPRFPFPIPNGWFIVAASDAVARRGDPSCPLLREGSDRLPYGGRYRQGDECILRAPRGPHRRRWTDQGGNRRMPVPRVVLRRRERSLLAHSVRLEPHPEQGGGPCLSHPRAQRHDLGVAPPRRRRPVLRRPRGARAL